ncbi:hypothetical protein C491_14342 [Natronococcus amylolyticus DSM 10524]|uniref:Uncharacterized protein n=1 Tax=Natronococcus amylolyticus DSM 10524 TaxID=1227497 RepID=L9X2Z6_9EURY|nr:hypothetical protein [Natronococcus amylolyticus]ELY56134.1 hypothetical protein C491_14342 [Natronococcus amylolyticus DSM 10524]
MTDEYDTRVAEILDEASTESETLLAPEASADDAGRDLLEVAREADEFVASSEPTALLEAVGLGTLPDGSEAESVFEAIARGDPERVEDLHRLLRLAKLGDRSDEDTLEDATSGIREAIQRAQSETEREDTDRDDPSDREPTTDEESEAEAEEGNGEAAADLGDRLREAMKSPLETFGDEIGDVQNQLEGVMANDTDGKGDGDEAEETDTREADEGDDGLLGLSDDGSGGLGSSESSRLSTMAPPPSERADMHAVKRHSTMPKRNR